MIRVVTCVIALSILGGCQTAAQIDARNSAEDNAKCRSFGLRQGGQDYARCRLELTQIRTVKELKEQEFYNQLMITSLEMMAQPPARTTTCTTNTWGQITCREN